MNHQPFLESEDLDLKYQPHFNKGPLLTTPTAKENNYKDQINNKPWKLVDSKTFIDNFANKPANELNYYQNKESILLNFVEPKVYTRKSKSSQLN